MSAPATRTSRLRIHAPAAAVRTRAFADDVRSGLGSRPRSLPCRHLYDAEGSRLFEAICELPEYYPTRAEREILERHGRAIVDQEPDFETVVELGSGSGRKTRLLLEACLARRSALRYVPIDISRTALEESAHFLLEALPGLEVEGVADSYERGMALLPALTRGPVLLLWLGSNLGNLKRHEARSFVTGLRRHLAGDDRLLLGIDLRKEPTVLERAYDDAAGVTARFNRNLLARANRELGADFDLEAFAHRATWLDKEGRVEISLVSRRDQQVRIEALDMEVDFAEGEAIHTEDSHKYDLEEIDALAAGAGFARERIWLDSGERFAVVRLAPKGQ